MFDQTLSLIIRLASAAVIAGWFLSALGELNARGYVRLGIPILIGAAILYLRNLDKSNRRWFKGRFVRLWRRPRALPIIYFIIFLLIVIGSLLHEPNNFDGLSYRVPKVLYWLEQGRWHWINAPYEAVNFTFPNYE